MRFPVVKRTSTCYFHIGPLHKVPRRRLHVAIRPTGRPREADLVPPLTDPAVFGASPFQGLRDVFGPYDTRIEVLVVVYLVVVVHQER